MRSLSLIIVLMLGYSVYAKSDFTKQIYPRVPIKNCATSLVAEEQDFESLLNIAAIVHDFDGKPRLLTGSYMTGAHESLMLKAGPFTIRDVSFLGEIRYKMVNGLPQISVANHSSGFYFDLQGKDWSTSGRTIPIRNDYESIPKSMRAFDFRGYRWNEGPVHLAPEFRGIKYNVRHYVQTSFNKLVSAKNELCRAYENQRPPRSIIVDYLKDNGFELDILGQVLTYYLDRNLMDYQKLPNVVATLILFYQDPIDLRSLCAIAREDLARESEIFLDLQFQAFSETK